MIEKRTEQKTALKTITFNTKTQAHRPMTSLLLSQKASEEAVNEKKSETRRHYHVHSQQQAKPHFDLKPIADGIKDLTIKAAGSPAGRPASDFIRVAKTTEVYTSDFMALCL